MAKRLVDNEGKSAAARIAYPASRFPGQMADEVEKRPRVQAAMSAMGEALEKEGVTDPFLAKRIKEGLDAEWQGEPDLKMRHEYVKTASKIKEEKKPDIQIHAHKHQHFMDDLKKAAGERAREE